MSLLLIRCPTCGSDELHVDIVQAIEVRFSGDGGDDIVIDSPSGDWDWGASSAARCQCGWVGTLAEATTETPDDIADLGYRIERGPMQDEAAFLRGKYWWTWGRDGVASIVTSLDEWGTVEAAAQAARVDHRDNAKPD